MEKTATRLAEEAARIIERLARNPEPTADELEHAALAADESAALSGTATRAADEAAESLRALADATVEIR